MMNPSIDNNRREVQLARLLFAALAIGFGFASISYAAFPSAIVAQFAQWDRALGGGASYPETQNRIWISLAAANVATLSLMSALRWKDMRKYQQLHIPLLFMKCTSAALFVAWWVAMPAARSLLVAAVGDFATALAIWYFPTRAFRTFNPVG